MSTEYISSGEFSIAKWAARRGLTICMQLSIFDIGVTYDSARVVADSPV